MRQSEEKEIDGNRWTVQQFSATEGLRVLSKLTKLLGGPVGKAIGGLQGEGSILDAKLDFAIFGDAIGELTSRMDEDEIINLVKRLLANTRCNNQEVLQQFDTLFMANYATLFKVILLVVEVNFKIPLAGYLAGVAEQAQANTSIQKAS